MLIVIINQVILITLKMEPVNGYVTTDTYGIETAVSSHNQSTLGIQVATGDHAALAVVVEHRPVS